MIREKAGAVALGALRGAPRTDLLENSVKTNFGEFTFRNCSKSRSVVTHEPISLAYRSKSSPYNPFRRLLRPSFWDYSYFLDSFSTRLGEYALLVFLRRGMTNVAWPNDQCH